MEIGHCSMYCEQLYCQADMSNTIEGDIDFLGVLTIDIELVISKSLTLRHVNYHLPSLTLTLESWKSLTLSGLSKLLSLAGPLIKKNPRCFIFRQFLCFHPAHKDRKVTVNIIKVTNSYSKVSKLINPLDNKRTVPFECRAAIIEGWKNYLALFRSISPSFY